jgi:hypothetical protein
LESSLKQQNLILQQAEQISPSSTSTPKTLTLTSHYSSDNQDGSSLSSRTSSPDPNHRQLRDSSTPQMNFLQKQKEMRERESQVRKKNIFLVELEIKLNFFNRHVHQVE